MTSVRPSMRVSIDAPSLNAGDGRAEFVGDSAQKAPLAVDEARQPLRHAIDGFTQLPEFVAAMNGEPGLQLALRIAPVAAVSWEMDRVRLRIRGNQQTTETRITASAAASQGL
jgi:hypothetical protein